jgi:hypothetical protein
MMLRNIPNKYTQATLLQEIDEFGFAGKYDFFYLPMDVHYRSNVGYAFINFTAPVDAMHFKYAFAQHRFQRYESYKIGGVCVAHLQGLDENLRHFEKKAVTQAKNGQYRPIVFDGNVRVEFEEAVLGAKLRVVANESELRSTAGAHRPSLVGAQTTKHRVSQRAPSPECVGQLFMRSKLAESLHNGEDQVRFTQTPPFTKPNVPVLDYKKPIGSQREVEWTEVTAVVEQKLLELMVSGSDAQAARPAGRPMLPKAPPGLPCPGTWERPQHPSPPGPAKTASQDPAYITFDKFSSSLVFGGYGKIGLESTELQDAVDTVTPRTNKLFLGSSFECIVSA